MFCGKCGQKIVGTERFCPRCGSQIERKDRSVHNNIISNGEKRKKTDICLVIALAIIALIIGGSITKKITANDVDTPIKIIAEAIENHDVKMMSKAFPNKLIRAEKKIRKLETDTVVKSFEDDLFGILEEEDEVSKITYKIGDTYVITSLAAQIIEEEIDECMKTHVRIEAAQNMEIRMKAYHVHEEMEEYNITVQVIKVGGNWYLNPLGVIAT